MDNQVIKASAGLPAEKPKFPPIIERLSKAYNMKPEMVELAKRVFAPTLSADQFELFLFECATKNLNPLSGDIKPIVFGSKVSVHVGIDARRKLAARSNLHVSTDINFVYALPDKTTVESKFRPHADAKLIAARAVVRKKLTAESDITGDFSGYAEVTEFGGADGKSGNYGKMQHTMIAKSSESEALRRAFPDIFANVYDEEEVKGSGTGKVVDIIQADVV